MIAPAVDFGPPWHLPALRAVLALAADRGLSPRPAGGGLVHLGEGARLCRLDGVFSDRTAFLAGQLCRSRWLTFRALHQAGLPVSQTMPANSVEAAIAAAAEIGYPVVLRPIQSAPPAAASPPARDAAGVAAAFRRHAPRGGIVAAAVPGSVRRHLVIDRTWRSADGEAQPSHPLDRLLVERAAAVCDIELAVVELTGARPDQPFTESGARITGLEPGLLAVAGIAGDPVALAGLYLDHLFAAPEDGRVPLVAVIGGESAAVAAEIAAAFEAVGRRVGLATGSGLSVDGLLLMGDDRRGDAGRDLLVDHGSVEAAVVELPPGGGERGGGPFDLLVLAGTAPPGAIELLLPRLRRGVVGPPGSPLAATVAAAALAWHGADDAGRAETVVAAAIAAGG